MAEQEKAKCCIGKDYDDWCGKAGFEAVLPERDNSGNPTGYYCIFHSPRINKHEVQVYGIKLLDDHLNDYISKERKENEICDLRGSIFHAQVLLKGFKGDNALNNLHLDSCEFKSELKVFDSEIKGRFSTDNTKFHSVILNKCDVSAEIDMSQIKKDNHLILNIENSKFDDFVSFKDITFQWTLIIYNTEFNETVDFSGCKFVDKVECHKKKDDGIVKFNKSVNFNNVIFEKEANFNYVEFCNATFNNSKFNDLAYFKSTTFKEEAGFNNVVFAKDAYFNSYRSNQKGSEFIDCIGDFSNTSFKKTSMFHKSTGSGLNFTKTSFEGKTFFTRLNHSSVDFEDAKFKEWVSFARSKINERTDFIGANFEEYVSFYETILGGVINFDLCVYEKEVDFQGTRFEENESIDTNAVSFKGAVFKKFIIFKNLVFEVPVDFSRAWFFEPAEFYSDKQKGMFDSELIFKNVNVQESIKFENINIEKGKFLDSDLLKFDFFNCSWSVDRKGRNIFYDELEILNKMKKGNKINAVEFHQLIKIETINRLNKKKYIEAYNWSRASEWHLREKEVATLRAKLKYLDIVDNIKQFFLVGKYKEFISSFFDYLGYRAYQLSSNYNESVLRSASILGISLVLFIIIQSFGVYYGYEAISTLKSMLYGLGSAVDLLPFVKIKNEIVQYGKIETIFIGIFQVLIYIQLALFGMSVRNKLRR